MKKEENLPIPTTASDRRMLNLGCGHRFHPDWVNMDIAPQHPGVQPCDLSQGIPFPEQTFDVVYHSAMIEHIRRAEAGPFMRECLRVLKPGGILRVTTPDLGRICELYLEMLRAVPGGGPPAEANLEWMTLEMYDQTVREQGGGGMLDYLRQQPLPNEAFVLERIGEEGRELLAMIRNSPAGSPTPAPAAGSGNDTTRALAIGRFRLAGEVHHWMYDRVSLARLFTAAGFVNPVVCGATESSIPGWSQYHLDTTPAGAVIKPDCFYMEARKPAGPVSHRPAPTATSSFGAWLESLPQANGFACISAQRNYAHAEEQYDAQYGVVTAHPEEGLGLCALLKFQGLDTGGPAIEIGCGSGFLTTGLAQGYPGSAVLVTDPSAAFVRMTRDRLAPSAAAPRLHYAILNGDDLALLPAGMFSLIALRSTLHHILDVPGFIGAGARALRPGGTLAMGAEPCESGYVLMGAVAQSIPAVLQAAGVELKPEWRESVRLFGETMKFYCRRDLDKSQAEDKHLFRVHELAGLGARHGLQLRYFANASFTDFTAGASPPPSHASFSVFFLSYLRYCMSFEPALVELIGRHLQDQLHYLDDCYRSHPGPLFTGVFLFVKTPA